MGSAKFAEFHVTLLHMMCIGYRFSRVGVRGTWRSGFATKRTRVEQ